MHFELADSPESNKQLLVRSLRLYQASLLHVFGLALLVAFIIFISRMLGFAVGLYKINFAFVNIYIFCVSILLLFVFTALLWRICCVITDAHDKILDDFWVASRKILLIVGAAIIQSLLFTCMTIVVYFLSHYIQKQPPHYAFYLTMILLISYFFAYVYIFFLFIFYLPLILTEDKGIFAALSKSISLVWGNWWRVFLLQIIPFLSYFILITILGVIFKINIDIYLSGSPEYIFATVINLFLVAIIIPLNGAFLLVQLRDLELRKAVASLEK